ncbi:MAG TPA: LCCL domain-containing protein [Candidatus Limnocylindria bacterium]|nr:LCCL domain-containing protein [Candidatus Limnocylindria bacterium]
MGTRMLRLAALGIASLAVASCLGVGPAATPTSAPTAPPTVQPPATPSATPAPAPTPTPTPTASPTTQPPAPTTAPPATSPTPASSDGPVADLCGTDWTTSAAVCDGQVGDRFTFQCPAGGRDSGIYGTDTYTDDSFVCVAAVHAGLITIATGGVVTIELTPGLSAYLGSTRNGVTSSNWGSWPTSFVLEGGAVDPLTALMAHIPSHLKSDCAEVTSFDAGVVVSVQCIDIPDTDGYVVYTLFDNLEHLNTAYAGNREFFGADTNANDCRSGPSETGYTYDNAPAGQVVCNTYTGVDPDGMVLFWSRDSLLILGTIAVYGSTFEDMYDLWATAGPNP